MREQQTALEIFRSLQPLEPREMVGLWRGRGIPAGHRVDGVLENLGWFGKRFRPDLRVDALLFCSGERRLIAIDPARILLRLALRFRKIGRMRVARNLFPYLQCGLRANGPVASLKSMPFDGVAGAAMLYDGQPIVVYFRRIHEQRIMGAMSGDERIYFFQLARVDEP
ncbi:GXWXG domain-containing protein [Sinorhizobium sp. 7-81]|uniref:GXWXG domain-containing protein n=1 Tax=Sinorhizobium sp. 8-89 TaxID=3049089 RepID=UPI0024C3CB80|nr:GXWXG domain-containing protein [Sinorhizobium sp. 8-89]MDK1494165.1 GXWXG domain-containing protein [Sinorhizobium sp. 8-89]